MKRWFWVLDVVVVVSFAVIGSDFHGFAFDFLGILRVATPFLIALGGGIAILRAWNKPLSIINGVLLAMISLAGGMAMRHYLWNEGTPKMFILVTGAYFLALMVGWRLIAVGFVWAKNRF